MEHPINELPRAILSRVIALAETAGVTLAAEFCRPGGPRGGGEKADIDVEIELFLRPALLSLCPGRFVGEECGIVEANSPWCWLVDPQDGTRAFLQGKRGGSVSIALLHEGTPVLGVVHAPDSPDRGFDTIAWAAGMPHLLRNGVEVVSDLTAQQLEPGAFVFLSHHSPRRPVVNGQRAAPAGFVPMPSIAYRLARVAIGDGVATASTSGPGDLDYGAGHALLIGARGVVIDQTGAPVTYTREGASRVEKCFGGAPDAVRAIAERNWAGATLINGETDPRRPARVTLDWPRLPDTAPLRRAQGALLGMIIGDATDATMQPGPAAEQAIAVARALADGSQAAAVLDALAAWRESWHGDPGEPTLRAVPAGIAARSLAEAASLATAIGGDPVLAAQIWRCIDGDPGNSAATGATGGALFGATHGRSALTAAKILATMACRPDSALGAARPRPDLYWPDDALELAEALLLRRTVPR